MIDQDYQQIMGFEQSCLDSADPLFFLNAIKNAECPSDGTSQGNRMLCHVAFKSVSAITVPNPVGAIKMCLGGIVRMEHAIHRAKRCDLRGGRWCGVWTMNPHGPEVSFIQWIRITVHARARGKGGANTTAYCSCC